jgi:secondary thiamine-phosphate synthase enzyme
MIRIFDFEISPPAKNALVRDGFIAKNITPEIAAMLRISGIQNGTVTIQSKHTTLGVQVNEDESGLNIFDFPDILGRIAPKGRPYVHDDLTVRTENLDPDHPERPNGHSHCRALFLPTSVVLVIQNGTLCLGSWQSISVLELDAPRENRQLKVCFMGE